MKSNDILEQNVGSLLGSTYDPPKLDPAARTRIRRQLVTTHGKTRPAAQPLIAIGFGLAAAAGVAMVAGALLGSDRTAGTGVVRDGQEVAFADGSTVVLDKGATIDVIGPRRVRVTGAALLDITPGKGTFTVETASGQLAVLGTRFVVDAGATSTLAAVIRGQVRLETSAGKVILHAGEQGVAAPGVAPTRSPAPRLSHLASWARTARKHLEGEAIQPVRNGTLFARETGLRPGQTESDREYPLPLSQLTVDAVIDHQVARIALDQTFENPQAQDLEGVYRFAIPPDAALQRFAMYVDGTLTESAVVDRMRGRRIYEELVYHRIDPGLVEWAGAGRLSMRVYPLRAQQDKRIVLAYTQSLPRLYDDWTMTVPLPEVDGSVDDVLFKVRVKGCAGCELHSPSHDVKVGTDGSDAIVSYHGAGETIGDSLVLVARDPRKDTQVASHADAEHRYLSVRARPDLGAAPGGDHRARTWVVVDDVSASRGPLERRAQADIVGRLLREIDEDDRVAVLTVDSIIREHGPLTRVDDVDRKAVRAFLTADDVGGVGATDLGAAFDRATAILSGVDARDAYVVYLGDGVVTGGDRGLAALRDKLRGKATFVGVGVGDGADAPTLAALADATGGATYSIDLADDLAWRSFDLVASLYTARVTGVTAALFDANGQRIAGETYLRAGQLGDGEELDLVARVPAAAQVAAVELTGSRDGAPWRTRIATTTTASTDGAYLPRMWAQRHVAALMLAKEDAIVVPPCAKLPCATEDELRTKHREDIRLQVVDLGKKFFLLSRHTSLLVLENDEMYKKYGVTKGAGDTWAPYALPAKVEVKKVAAVSSGAPGIDPTGALVRTPVAVFYDYGAVYKQQLAWRNGAIATARSAGVVGVPAGGVFSDTIGHGSGTGRGYGPSIVDLASRDEEKPEESGAEGQARLQAESTELDADDGVMALAEGKMGKSFDRKRDDNDFAGADASQPMTVSTSTLTRSTGQWMVADKRASTKAHGGERRGSSRSYWGNGGQPPYPIAFHYAADPRLDDLTEFVPAMFPGPVDAAEADLIAAAGNAKGSVTAAARTLIDRARDALPDGVYKLGDGPSITVHDGELAWRSTDAYGLEELARLDGTTWRRAYPELGLEVARDLGNAAPAVLLTYLPILVPAADQLSTWFAVSTQGARTLVLAPASAPDKPMLTIELDDQARVIAIKTAAGTELLSMTWGKSGPTAATVGGAKTPIAFGTTLDLVAFPAGLVGVSLPLMQPVKAKEAATALTAGTPVWRAAQRQLMAGAAAMGDTSSMLTAFDALLGAGGVELGDVVLASRALGSADDKTQSRAFAGFGGDPVARPAPLRYLAAASAYQRKAKPETIAPAVDTGLVGSLWRHRHALALVHADKREAAVAAVEALGDRAPELGLVEASVIGQQWNWPVGLKARAWEAVARGELRNVARYEAARTAYGVGDYVMAADRFARLLAEIDLAAAPVQIDYYAMGALQNGRGQAGFDMAWRPYLTRVIADGDYDHVVALATSAAQLSRTADVDRALGRATELAGTDRSRLIDVLQLAVELGQTERAAALLPAVTAGDPDPSVERLAMQLSLAQGEPGAAADHLERAIAADSGPAPLSSVRVDFATLISLRGRVAQLAIGTAKDDAIGKMLATSRQWREVDPANSAIDSLVGELLLDLDRPEEGMRQLSTAIERNPLDGAGSILVADTLERHGRYDQALATWQEALVIDQTNPGPRLRKAQLLYAMGRAPEADVIVKDAVARKWHDRFWNDSYQLQQLAQQHKLTPVKPVR